MGKYYYLVASLPYLKFGRESPLSSDAFLGECRKWFPEEQLEKLADINIKNPAPKPGDTEMTRNWKIFDMELRQTIARFRGVGQKGPGRAIPHFLKDVMEQKDPLIREKEIEKVRWDYLDGESHKYLFDENVLAIYYIKLQIMERLAAFDAGKGQHKFNKLCEVNL